MHIYLIYICNILYILHIKWIKFCSKLSIVYLMKSHYSYLVVLNCMGSKTICVHSPTFRDGLLELKVTSSLPLLLILIYIYIYTYNPYLQYIYIYIMNI